MRHHRVLPVAFFLAVAAGCSEDEATGPGGGEDNGGSEPVVASVEIAPSSVMIWELGATVGLQAVARDASGNPVSGAVFEWTSVDPSIAGVDGSGLVTGAGDGWTVIRARTGSVAGGADAVVIPPDADRSRMDCFACHADDYVRRHGGTATPETCLLCHRGPGWTGATIDHALVSGGFRLLGAHESLSCGSCHAPDGTPLYPGASDDDCIACHAADYDAQHAGSGYPTTCLDCHTRDSWAGATFDHETASDGFTLLGVHATLTCTACHEADDGTPLYPGASQTDCYGCHAADYEAQHAGSGYPTDCLVCHDTTAWADATFDHDAQYFPIYSGIHWNKWSSCSTCHVDPGDYGAFSCFACHGERSMEQRHTGVDGYRYDSSACYACHPTGEI
jgi:hypothetical protein